MIKNFKNNLMFGIACACISVVQAASTSTGIYNEKLKAISGATLEVEMPFPYIRLQSQEDQKDKQVLDLKYSDGHCFNKQTVFVPEFFYAMIGKGLEAQSALVGPLSPCFLIAVRHKKKDRALVFHFNTSSGIRGVTDTVFKEFGEKLAPQELTVKIFTCGYEKKDTIRTIAFHQRDLETISNGLKSILKIKESSFKKNFYTSTKPVTDQMEFFAVDRTLFVDKDLNLRSTTFLNEQVFGRVNPENKKKYLDSSFYNVITSFYIESLIKDEMGNPMKKDVRETLMRAFKLPFFRIPDTQAGLGWLPVIASGLVKNVDNLEELQKAKFVVTPLGKELLDGYKANP